MVLNHEEAAIREVVRWSGEVNDSAASVDEQKATVIVAELGYRPEASNRDRQEGEPVGTRGGIDVTVETPHVAIGTMDH
jgi:hypothetical protein